VNGIKIFAEISGLLGVVFGLLCSGFMIFYFWIIDKIENVSANNFFDVMKISYGKTAAIFIGAALALISLFNASMRLKMFLSAVTDIILPDSPEAFVAIFFVIAIFAVSFLGLESLTRYALPTGVVIVALVLFTGIFNLENYRFSNIFPLMGNGYKMSKNVPDGIFLFSDIIYLYFLTGFFKKKHAIKRVWLKSVVLSGALITVVIGLYQLAVPYPASIGFDYPYFRLASLANTSVLFQRIDAVVYIIWLFSGFVSTGALALFTMIIFAENFDMSDYKGIIHIVIFLIIAFSALDKNYFNLLSNVFTLAVLIFIPVTAILYRFKALSRRKNNEA